MEQLDILQDWKKRTGVLATMHHKETVISPALKEGLGVEVIVPSNFNTDHFGTFARDIKRIGNQLEAARTKAQAAMRLTGLDLGISSEGSFASHPATPFVQSNLEIVVLLDAINELEIIGHYRSGNAQARSQIVQLNSNLRCNTALDTLPLESANQETFLEYGSLSEPRHLVVSG